jgi:AcrR family transcriptional regulator
VTLNRYSSPLREEQARETRRRIQDAARGLFEESGFAATTIIEIARRAGVSPATIYATFVSKAGIVASMLAHLEEAAGMDERIPEMVAEEDPHRGIALFVAGNRAVFEVGHVILRAAYDAMGIPEVRDLALAGDANRRVGVDNMVARWHKAGVIRPHLTRKEAAETMWLLTSVEQYLLATDVLGWSGEAYELWLRTMLTDVLLVTAD